MSINCEPTNMHALHIILQWSDSDIQCILYIYTIHVYYDCILWLCTIHVYDTCILWCILCWMKEEEGGYSGVCGEVIFFWTPELDEKPTRKKIFRFLPENLNLHTASNFGSKLDIFFAFVTSLLAIASQAKTDMLRFCCHYQNMQKKVPVFHEIDTK